MTGGGVEYMFTFCIALYLGSQKMIGPYFHVLKLQNLGIDPIKILPSVIFIYKELMELDLFAWKICASCQIKKRTEEFGKNKSQLGGLHYYCKKCVREKSKKNDLKYKAYQKLWRQKNSESVKEYQK